MKKQEENGRITIREIAKKANVSIGTVDRVIHNRGKVASDKEKKIRQIINEYKYKPNVFARHLKLSKNFTFGVLIPKPYQDSYYWKLPVEGIDKALGELQSNKVEIKHYYFDKYVKSSFKKESRKILKSPPDGLLLAPTLYEESEEFLRKIPDTIPYVFFDSFIPGTKNISYIGQDSYRSGILSGKLMKILIKDRGTIASLRVLPEDFHINERIKGFNSFFEDKPDFELITYDVDGKKGDQEYFKLVELIISRHKDLKGIFISNASTHLVAKYIDLSSLKDKIHVIGYDLITENRIFLKKGIIDFIIDQSPRTQGYQGIYSLYRHVVLKEKIEKSIMMPMNIVTRENLDYY